MPRLAPAVLAHLAPALALWLSLAACTPGDTRPLCEPGRPCPTASEAACAHGPEARLYGRAAWVNGTCGPRDDASCRAASLTCAHFGQCSAPSTSSPPATGAAASGTCPGESDRDFLASRLPACAVGTCVATADADCRAARVCALEGRCTARNGVCVATDPAACRASEHCQTLGWCTLHPDAMCRAGSVADCANARACTDFGDCGFREGVCVACAKSSECKAEGRCERVGTACKATAPQHCRASEACRGAGRCRAFQGACVK